MILANYLLSWFGQIGLWPSWFGVDGSYCSRVGIDDMVCVPICVAQMVWPTVSGRVGAQIKSIS